MYYLKTGASDGAIGGVLQILIKTDKLLPVAYNFRVLHPTKKHYVIKDKESVAILD